MLNTKFGLAALISTLAAGTATADPYDSVQEKEKPDMLSYAWNDPTLRSGIGIGFSFGAGIAGFTSKMIRDNVDSSVSGLWTARATLGTHVPIGLDVSYVGTAVDISPIGATTKGTLVGTAVEGALRWNILPHYSVNPYVFAGVGWQRLDVTGASFSQSDTGLKDSDTMAVFPMGAGLSYRDGGLSIDLRGTFRPAQGADLLQDNGSGSKATEHTWDASAALGYEF